MDRQRLIDAPRELPTARLRLQSPRVEHAEAFVESLNRSLPGLRFITWAQQAQDLVWAQDFCRRGRAWVEAGEGLVFNAFVQETGAYLGRIDLHSFDFETPRCEIGYVADLSYQGRGLMREAVLAVIALGFDLGLVRIHALSDARNQRALDFAAGLGMVHEGVLRAYERDPQGALCDMVMFAAVQPSLS